MLVMGYKPGVSTQHAGAHVFNSVVACKHRRCGVVVIGGHSLHCVGGWVGGCCVASCTAERAVSRPFTSADTALVPGARAPSIQCIYRPRYAA